MKNPFKQILADEKLPDIVREKVIKDINLINLSIDLADLFLVKNPDLFKTLFSDEEEDDDKNDPNQSPTTNTK